MSGKILVVDDDRSFCETLETGLSRRGFQVRYETRPEMAFEILRREDFDTVVTDLNMPGWNGLDLCRNIGAIRPQVPVIVITAFGSLEAAIGAIRAGAYDFITKPFELEVLVLALERAVQHRALQDQVQRLQIAVEETRRLGDLIGASPPMVELFQLMEKVAGTETSILIEGETGTGKELVAKAIHQRSRRRQGPFVALNCTAFPETLLESELFGNKAGAFTGAVSDRKGLLLEAAGGTLFLDEVAELPATLQPKLLRVLQERKVRPLGGSKEIPFDTRILSATNRDLEAEVEEGRFRKDLFFRIQVVRIFVPPLRSRGNDILLLAQHFLNHYSSLIGKKTLELSGAAAEKLLKYGWPGNVRELQNCMERAMALCQQNKIGIEDLPEKIQDYQRPLLFSAGVDPLEGLPMKEVEKRYIQKVLEAAGGNQTLAARTLGFDRKTLYRKLKQYKISN